jgi:flap endonuclease-1
MGIKGIKALIKKHVPDAIRPITFSDLQGKTVCIDSSILLYKYKYTYNEENFHILGFLNKILELMDYQIKVIFVFDGKPPDAKRNVLNKRKEENDKRKEQLKILKENLVSNDEAFIDSDTESENVKETVKKIKALEKNIKTVTRQHSTETIELLKSLGIPFFVAETEAEKACVFLQKNGYADYIFTDDTDTLAFGASFIYSSKNSYFLCEIDKILQGLDITQKEFVDLCILCGCDYTCTIPKIGPVGALNIIKKHRTIKQFLECDKIIVPETFDYQMAQQLFEINETGSIEFETSKDRIKFKELLSRWNLNSFISKFHFFEILI